MDKLFYFEFCHDDMIQSWMNYFILLWHGEMVQSWTNYFILNFVMDGWMDDACPCRVEQTVLFWILSWWNGSELNNYFILNSVMVADGVGDSELNKIKYFEFFHGEVCR